MSSVDPANSQQRTSSITSLDSQNFDPATILLALSMGQMGVLQDSLLARVPSTRDQLNTLERIGTTSAQLTKLKDSVLAEERGDAEKQLQQLEAFRARHVTGDDNKLVVNDAEQRDLARALEWAEQRGFPHIELTKEVPVPKPQKSEDDAKAEGKKPAEEEPVEMQTVLDEQKFLGFRDALRSYIGDLKTGEVDNPAIRHLMTSDSRYDRLEANAKSLGIDSNLDSPAKIDAAINELNSQWDKMMKGADQSAGQLKVLTDRVGQTASGLVDLNRSQFQTDTRSTDRQNADENQRIQNLQLDKNREDQLQQIQNALQSAQTALDQLSALNQGKNLTRDLPVSAQMDVQSKLSGWQQDLKNDLESTQPAPLPEKRLFRPASAYV